MKSVLGGFVLLALLAIGSVFVWSAMSKEARSEAQAKAAAVQQKEEIASLRSAMKQLTVERSQQLKLMAEQKAGKSGDLDSLLNKWELEASLRLQQAKSAQNYPEAAANLFDVAAIRSARNPGKTN